MDQSFKYATALWFDQTPVLAMPDGSLVALHMTWEQAVDTWWVAKHGSPRINDLNANNRKD